jgi:predicted Holliday junction resolvase-like endonuclease
MSDALIMAFIIPAKLIIIYLIVSYFKRKKAREAQRNAEVIERMQIREYGRKINEATRNKRLN